MSRTKTRAIIVNVTGETAQKNLIENLRENNFSLLVDESTDKSTIKHLALIVRTEDDNFQVEDRVAAIVGQKFGEVLFIGVKNKYCIICAKAQKRKESPKEHSCYKNFEGPSSGMEAAIIYEGFKKSIELYDIMYG